MTVTNAFVLKVLSSLLKNVPPTGGAILKMYIKELRGKNIKKSETKPCFRLREWTIEMQRTFMHVNIENYDVRGWNGFRQLRMP